MAQIKYPKLFLRFIEYYAGVKAASMKRHLIADMAFDNLSTTKEFASYLNYGKSCGTLYAFYLDYKEKPLLKEFFEFRKTKENNIEKIKQYKKISGNSYHKFYESKEWIKLSALVKRIYGRKCMKCSDTKSIMHTDHIVPRSIDVSKELDINNLQVLCEKCNTDKSNLNWNDYRTDIDLLKLKAHLEKSVFVPPTMNIKTWIEANRSKLPKKQVEILVELWSEHKSSNSY